MKTKFRAFLKSIPSKAAVTTEGWLVDEVFDTPEAAMKRAHELLKQGYPSWASGDVEVRAFQTVKLKEDPSDG